jgi:hypothetical protein
MSAKQTYRLVGGRRHFNKARQLEANHRREQVRRLLAHIGTTRGYGARLAEALGVRKATTTRDLQALAADTRRCPCCGAVRDRRRSVGNEEEE